MRNERWLSGVPVRKSKEKSPFYQRKKLSDRKAENNQVNHEGGCILDKKTAARKARKMSSSQS